MNPRKIPTNLEMERIAARYPFFNLYLKEDKWAFDPNPIMRCCEIIEADTFIDLVKKRLKTLSPEIKKAKQK